LIHMKNTVFLPSLAGKGRSIHEVLLFSPKIKNLFYWQDINVERFILLGWGLTILAVLGLVSLFRSNPSHRGKRAMAGVMAFMAIVLTLGPTLNYFPLYQFLYTHFPFFNYPRVPARFAMVGIIFLCLLAGLTLSDMREWAASKGWIRLKRWFPLLIIPLVLAEYHSWRPLGLSDMTGYSRVYQEINRRLPQGKLVLELPVWPGDSHQSSAYEYTVTRTRKPMVNGYAPVVFREYIKQVFWPLYPLDFGEQGEIQAEELKKLKVDLITFHDNSMIYTDKISPFPPRLALKRLMASPILDLLDQDQDVTLFKVKPDVPSGHKPLGKEGKPPVLSGDKSLSSLEKGKDGGGFSGITSPVAAVFYVNNQPHETGRYQLDPSASGYYLLMDEKGLTQGHLIPRPGVRGNVICAIPGQDRPGFLTLGTHRFFPSGKYRVRFRVKAGAKTPQQEIGRVEVVQNKTKVAVQRTLQGSDFTHSEKWTDIPLEFEITKAQEMGFRLFYSGQTPLYFNLAVVGFADQSTGPGSIEAEDLMRQTGMIVPDPLASGQEGILGKSGFHPPIYLCYGPYRTFDPGRYRAHFFIRLKETAKINPNEEVALLEVATDMGKRVFEKKIIIAGDLSSKEYRSMDLTFTVPFRCELGYRVKYLGRSDLLVDRVSVVDFNEGNGNNLLSR
jgi:hypothetical protein